MADTSIEWTDKVWNPVTGCTKVSAACKNCYAERVAKRFWGDREFTDVRCHPDRLDQPLRWRKPRRIFVDSMGDLFHEAVPSTFLDRAFAVMALARRHTFIVLTKRPEKARRYLDPKPRSIAGYNRPGLIYYRCLDYGATVPQTYKREWPLPNVWFGVSVEDQKTADERIPLLLETPAAARVVSCEPLLGPIDIEALWSRRTYRGDTISGYMDYDDVDWVIVGGESGPGARPCAVDWIRNIITQCRAAHVKCFVKQLGSYAVYLPPYEWADGGGRRIYEVNHPKGAEPSEWPAELRVRELPK